jgi:radical SAM/Cys-rich protein
MTPDFKNRLSLLDESFIKRSRLDILQVNLGNRCNQECIHCHVGASPSGENSMAKEIIDAVIRFLRGANEKITLDLTGGCPEFNPHFKYLIEKAGSCAKKIIVRNNLTVLLEPGMGDLPEFFRKNEVHLICSLPCYTRQNVDRQRGSGVFDKSMEALKLLNLSGYGKLDRLELDLVYNPGGAFLPGEQSALEKDYKKTLLEQFGVVFNRLLTITNAPIKRFRDYLEQKGELEKYMSRLVDNFNGGIAESLMCRNLVSVGWDGRLYDCDFNQALGMDIKDIYGNSLKICEADPRDLEGLEIIFDSHCYSCAAGAGSSCQGELRQRGGK